MMQAPVSHWEESGFYSKWHEKPLEGFEQLRRVVLPDPKEAPVVDRFACGGQK